MPLDKVSLHLLTHLIITSTAACLILDCYRLSLSCSTLVPSQLLLLFLSSVCPPPCPAWRVLTSNKSRCIRLHHKSMIKIPVSLSGTKQNGWHCSNPFRKLSIQSSPAENNSQDVKILWATYTDTFRPWVTLGPSWSLQQRKDCWEGPTVWITGKSVI